MPTYFFSVYDACESVGLYQLMTNGLWGDSPDTRAEFFLVMVSVPLIFTSGISSQSKEIMTFASFGTKLFNGGVCVKRF